MNYLCSQVIARLMIISPQEFFLLRKQGLNLADLVTSIGMGRRQCLMTEMLRFLDKLNELGLCIELYQRCPVELRHCFADLFTCSLLICDGIVQVRFTCCKV